MTQVVGIVDLYWGGAKVDIKNDGTFMRGGLRNKEVIVGRKVFRSQQMMPGTVTVTAVLPRGKRFADLFPGDDQEVQVHTDAGHIFVAPTGFVTEDPELTMGDNHGVKVTIKSDAFEEQ